MKKELNAARLRLMFLYLAIGSLLVLAIGAMTFFLNNHYLLASVDGLLKQKMALLFQANLAVVPPELASHLENEPKNGNLPTNDSFFSDENDDSFKWITSTDDEHAYVNDLAGIFILPLDASGKQLSNPNPFPPPIQSDALAAHAAIQNGSDLRTIRSQDGVSYRLLSYRLENAGSAAVVQMGKSLSEQEKLSSQFLLGLFFIGIFGVAGLGLASWWLSGRALQPAMQAWDQQQAFIANAGHELRTPLTIIRSEMEIVQRSGLKPDQDEMINDALAECDHMNKLVEDLLLLSRLDHQHVTFEFTDVDLKQLIEEVCRKIKLLAAEKGIAIHNKIPDSTVLGDALRLRQVFLILLDNAMRNTESGGRINISARKERNIWEIKVSDNGIGIPAQDLDHLFERFYRINRASENDYTGNGLGLSIAKSIIEAHHGTIQITSQAGQGTTVTLTLPVFSIS
jgi:signal transduction histidine kinase